MKEILSLYDGATHYQVSKKGDFIHKGSKYREGCWIPECSIKHIGGGRYMIGYFDHYGVGRNDYNRQDLINCYKILFPSGIQQVELGVINTKYSVVRSGNDYKAKYGDWFLGKYVNKYSKKFPITVFKTYRYDFMDSATFTKEEAEEMIKIHKKQGKWWFKLKREVIC